MAAKKNGINGDPAALLIDRAISELRRGRAIELLDSGARFIVLAVETMQPPLFERLKYLASATPRLILTAERGAALGIAAEPGCAIGVAIDEQWGVNTVRALAGATAAKAPETALVTDADERALMRAALQLTKAGRLVPALLVAPVNDVDDDSMLSITTEQLTPYTVISRNQLRRTSQARVPLADAVDCEIVLFRDEHALSEHVAVIIGDPDPQTVVPVRLHSACLTGDLLASLRCDCGEQLRTAVARIAELGGGVLLYLDQEGRGIGLPNKLRAYSLQDAGLDTLDADRHLGFLADERNYDVAALLLKELGITSIRLLTNNPQKIAALKDHGIDVIGRLPLVATTNAHNERYIRAKRERAGHLAEEPGA
jgi:GTP cyclohydrolase II